MKFWKSLPENGFTLIELLITLAISGVIMTGIYTAFKSQQDSYLAQEQVAQTQQNIRAGVDIMARDLRMAGFRGNGGSNANILDAQVDAISFSADLNEDGDTADNGENIAYDRYDSGATDGWSLGRASAGAIVTLAEPTAGSGHFEAAGHQPFVPEIEGLEFFYTLENGSQTTTPADPATIRSIQISILARARQPDRNYTHTNTYTTPSTAVWGPFNDNFRRRFQITTVNLRNMGL